MTLANLITMARIGIIPAFAGLAWYYGYSTHHPPAMEWARVAAAIVFGLAAATDGVDGYIARHFNQESELGALLDPIADKGLILTAILVLSTWEFGLPLWFVILVIGRDVGLALGCLLINARRGRVTVRPSWSGKTATVLQLIAIAWVLLGIPAGLRIWVWSAAALIVWSGLGYLVDGLRQLREAD
jgi:CDP-diacylglycerol--glycerol-3-phosphate 3-phosphatidyltransferase